MPKSPSDEAIREVDRWAQEGYYYDKRDGGRTLLELQPRQPVLTKLDTEKKCSSSAMVID